MKSPYHPKGVATKTRKLCWRSQRPTLRTGNIQNWEMGIHSQLVRLMLHKQVDVAVEFRLTRLRPMRRVTDRYLNASGRLERSYLPLLLLWHGDVRSDMEYFC